MIIGAAPYTKASLHPYKEPINSQIQFGAGAVAMTATEVRVLGALAEEIKQISIWKVSANRLLGGFFSNGHPDWPIHSKGIRQTWFHEVLKAKMGLSEEQSDAALTGLKQKGLIDPYNFFEPSLNAGKGETIPVYFITKEGKKLLKQSH